MKREVEKLNAIKFQFHNGNLDVFTTQGYMVICVLIMFQFHDGNVEDVIFLKFVNIMMIFIVSIP